MPLLMSTESDSFHFFFIQLDDMYTCVNFTVERWYPVANMSRYLPIRVYDYYAPGKQSCKKVLFARKYFFQKASVIVSTKMWVRG